MDTLCRRLSGACGEWAIAEWLSDTKVQWPQGAVTDQIHDPARRNGPSFHGIKACPHVTDVALHPWHYKTGLPVWSHSC